MTVGSPASGIRPERRAVLAMIGAGVASATLAARGRAAAPLGGGAPDAEAAVRRALATAPDGLPDLVARLAFLVDDALVITDDVPFPLDRAGYADHSRFEQDQWHSLELVLDAVESRRHGDGAVVTGFYMARGKPKDAGYRLRAGYLTAVCVMVGGAWRGAGLHMAPLSGQLRDASPS